MVAILRGLAAMILAMASATLMLSTLLGGLLSERAWRTAAVI